MAGGLEQVDIKASRDRVYDFCSTPENWPKVFNVTKWVWRLHCKLPTGPLQVGDIFEEHIIMLGMPVTFQWTCTQADRNLGRFEFKGIVTNALMRFLGGGYTVIAYNILPIPGQSIESSRNGFAGDGQTQIETSLAPGDARTCHTRYIRYFNYLQYGLLMKTVHALFLNSVMQRDFVATLKKIKDRLERPAAYAEADRAFERDQTKVMAEVARKKGFQPGEHLTLVDDPKAADPDLGHSVG